MKRIAVGLVGLACIAGLVTYFVNERGPGAQQPRAAVTSFPENEESLKVAALEGSTSSAADLAGTYGMHAMYGDAIFWGMIAVENGGERARGASYNLGFELLLSSDALQRRRGLYWLRQLRDGNDEIAVLARSRLDEMKVKNEQAIGRLKDFETGRWPQWTDDFAAHDKGLHDLMERAVEGSEEAALDLSRRYVGQSRHAEAVFWGMIAVENASVVCRSACPFLSKLLGRSSDQMNQRRARYWHKRLTVESGQNLGEAVAPADAVQRPIQEPDVSERFCAAKVFRTSTAMCGSP